MRRLICSVIALALCAGCSTEVDGPEPQLADDPDELATDPSFVCSQDHGDDGTWITLDGSDFSPLVVDAIASENDHDAELPVLTLFLQTDETGEDVELQQFQLDSPLGADDGQIRWLDDETLQFRVDDDLELPEGVYDIEVENPAGGVALETEAFGVIDRPEVHTAIPEMTCVAQGERTVRLEGENLLVRGDEDQVPTLRIDGEEVEVVDDSLDDCRQLHSTFTDHQLCREATIRVDEQQFEAGVYDITAENFAPAGCSSRPDEDDVTLTVNAPPQVDDISPSPVCSEQIAYEAMEVDGAEFITIDDDGDTIYPDVQVGDQIFGAVDATGCESVDSAPVLGAERCDQLLIDVDDGDLADQVADETTHEDLHVQVTNPDPVGCHSEEDEFLTAMPRPQVDDIDPDPMCTAQYENTFVVSGHGFAEIDGEQPVVHIGDHSYDVDEDDLEGCTDITTPDVETRSCDRLTIAIAEDDLELGRNDVTIENPETAGCESTDDRGVEVVPPPTVADVEPDPFCTEQDDRTLTVDGSDFLDIDGELPDIAIGDETFATDALDECDELAVDGDDREVHRCEELTVTVGADILDDGLHDVVVTNPEGAQCSSEDDVDVETVPPPVITSVEPRAVCSDDEEGTDFVVEGQNLYEVDGQTPTIVLDNFEYGTTVEDGDCETVDDDVRLCNTVAFTADADEVSDDVHDLVAVNPEEIGCQSEPFEDSILLAGPPVLDSADPGAICETDTLDGPMSLFGEFLHDTEGADPIISMNGSEPDIDGFGGCDETGVENIDQCDELQTTVPPELRDEEFEITVAANDPVACGTSEPLLIERVEEAQVDSVDPGRVCIEGGTFTVIGSNFDDNLEAYLDDEPASDVVVYEENGQEKADLTFEGELDPPEMALKVVNPGDCGDDHVEDINIEQAPIPLYVDPPATFDGMTTQVTIYAAGVGGGNIDEVELVHPDDGPVATLETTIDEDRPYIVQATVPEGLLDDDEVSVDFGVRITDDFDCQSDTQQLLTITSEPTIALDEIRPPFGSDDEDTLVTITAEDDIDADEDQFEPTPRAYLNPADIEGDIETARELGSIQYIDETQLNGIISAGLPLGTYDLIVVNPDGAVGVLEESYDVVDESPPFVDSVSPGSWTNDDDDISVAVEGGNFADNATVEVFCQQPDEDLDEDDMRQPEIEVVAIDDDHIDLSVDATDLNHLDACFMRVTNPDAGTWGEYSPITVTNPSGKFMEFYAGAEFDTPRRGPTLLSGDPARRANYLYILGGDDGSLDGEIYRTGEYSAVDRFGQPRDWNDLRFDLPEGRSLANGVRVDDFLYLIGGAAEDGLAADEIYRAHIPTPSEAPEIVGLDLVYDEEDFEDEDDEPDADDGLDAGLYYYRVAATYSGDDPANPDGESIASEPQPVNVPLDGATVTIEWNPPEEVTNHDIDGYRVYRSVEPDSIYGEEEHLATVDDTTFEYTDDDAITPSGDEPLSIGALGNWHHVTDLASPRMVAGIDSIENPDEDGEHLVYVVGGEDETTEFRADYEYFSVDVGAPRHQSIGMEPAIGQFEGEPMELPGPRGELEIGIAHGDNAPSVADVRPQIFVIGGQSEGTDNNRNLYVSTITEGGELDDWTALDGPGETLNNDRHGHAGAAINDNLVVAGGNFGEPTDSARHAEIECDTDNDCPPAGIDTSQGGWEDFGENLVEERVWMGRHVFRGFWYLGGGLTTGGVPTNTVEFTVAGGAP